MIVRLCAALLLAQAALSAPLIDDPHRSMVVVECTGAECLDIIDNPGETLTWRSATDADFTWTAKLGLAYADAMAVALEQWNALVGSMPAPAPAMKPSPSMPVPPQPAANPKKTNSAASDRNPADSVDTPSDDETNDQTEPAEKDEEEEDEPKEPKSRPKKPADASKKDGKATTPATPPAAPKSPAAPKPAATPKAKAPTPATPAPAPKAPVPAPPTPVPAPATPAPVPPPSRPPPPPDANKRCGGKGDGCKGDQCKDAAWTDVKCHTGYTCQRQNEWYWDCQDDFVKPAALTDIPADKQCGGKSGWCQAFAGACKDAAWGTCASGLECKRMNEYFWECTTGKTTAAQVQTPAVAEAPKPAPAPVPEAPKPAPPAAIPAGSRYKPSQKVTRELEPIDSGAGGHTHAGPNGHNLKRADLDPIFGKLNFPPIDAMADKLDSLGAWYGTQSDDRKVFAAYTVLAGAAKFKTLSPSKFPGCDSLCEPAQLCIGKIKTAAMKKEMAVMQDELKKCGGDAQGLTPAELMALWGGNEHNVLHAMLTGNPVIFNALHATSLNEQAGDGSLQAKGPMGGYNDKGAFPQWGWFDNAKQFEALLGI